MTRSRKARTYTECITIEAVHPPRKAPLYFWMRRARNGKGVTRSVQTFTKKRYASYAGRQANPGVRVVVEP